MINFPIYTPVTTICNIIPCESLNSHTIDEKFTLSFNLIRVFTELMDTVRQRAVDDKRHSTSSLSAKQK